jgi:3-oxoacyl-[acyl-carrier-protein] synthase III
MPSARPGAAAVSVGSSLPEGVLLNAEIEARLELAPGWISRRTGIESRRQATPDERLQTHATAAARQALDRAGVSAEEVELVIVATSTADEIMPGAAPLVAHDLGATRAGAFDLGAACTGFLSALSVGSAQIESGRVGTVVIVGADLMSRITDPVDRSTAVVFGDGAGAVVLQATEADSLIGPVILGADGAGADHIRVGREDGMIRMRGHETFREAVAKLSLCTEQAIRAADVALDEIDLFVYHQANGRILTAVGERLGLDRAKVVDCIAQLGNTTAGTLPLALDYAQRDGRLVPGAKVLLGAFGAGFTWGASVITWAHPPAHPPGPPTRG